VRRNGIGLLAAIVFWAGPAAQSLPAKEAAKWPAEVEQALDRAGTNRAELEKALADTPADQRKGMVFLIANMPDRDLRTLRADFLLENLGLAYKARREQPWARQIPEEIFLNDVLPYANFDEARHPWRKELYELSLPLVKACKTPAEAAQQLNAKLFPKVKVRFSTTRKKAQQSPKETMEQGVASCSGLSILLVDACRSVGVPARVAGTPLWSNKTGNHSWVEVWDGHWHFTGAAEPDGRGLDHAWFEGNAAEAQKDSRLHAIYAVSFKKTGVTFPLVWAPQSKDVYAVNVTDRYARAKPAAKSPLSNEQTVRIEEAARAYFTADAERQKNWKFDAALDGWLAEHEEAVRRVVWNAYKSAPIHGKLKEDFDKKQVRYDKHLSPYTLKQVGTKPPGGWPLFIAMHGGGGVPKEINDSQWRHMQIYYRDQKTPPGYLYLALRAPNDVWNGFYDEYVPPLVTNLIRQFLLFGDVDPDHVYLMGYSHGGYGAFFIGPKIPDRFAAVHASASAPTDGTISPQSLRNTRFTFMIGGKDTMYGRRERCEKFNAEIQKLKAKDKDDFPVEMELKEGFGHGGLPDRDKIKDLAAYTRNPVPRHLTWDLTDGVIKDFFWLSVARPEKGMSIDARIDGNELKLLSRKVQEFDVYLDGRLVTYGQPLRVTHNDYQLKVELRPRLLTLCQSLLVRGDPRLAFACRVRLDARSN
jgi:hypothetical protein